jgi:hypothetical protein
MFVLLVVKYFELLAYLIVIFVSSVAKSKTKKKVCTPQHFLIEEFSFFIEEFKFMVVVGWTFFLLLSR